MKKLIEGHCLCKAVYYQAESFEKTIVHCHCAYCQKNHSAAFSTNIVVSSASFQVTKGEALLHYYESSPGKMRAFCSCCGSSLFHRAQATPDKVTLKAGSIEHFTDFQEAEFQQYHINCESDKPWMRYENQPKYPLVKQ